MDTTGQANVYRGFKFNQDSYISTAALSELPEWPQTEETVHMGTGMSW